MLDLCIKNLVLVCVSWGFPFLSCDTALGSIQNFVASKCAMSFSCHKHRGW